MKHSNTLLAAALGLLVASSMPAQADSHGEDKVNNYVKETNGTVVVDSNGDCVRTYDMTDVRLEECGYGEADIMVKKEPEAVAVAVVAEGTVLEAVVIDNLQFEFDSAVLTDSDKAILDEAYTRLTPYKDLFRAKTSHIDVIGHTDSTGPEEYNQGLSERRANAVADYMASKGTPREAMIVKGMGETSPVADNATREGRRLNRRVELNVIK
jgi:OOP family OmpA-OmpF porin